MDKDSNCRHNKTVIQCIIKRETGEAKRSFVMRIDSTISEITPIHI